MDFASLLGGIASKFGGGQQGGSQGGGMPSPLGGNKNSGFATKIVGAINPMAGKIMEQIGNKTRENAGELTAQNATVQDNLKQARLRGFGRPRGVMA